MYWDVLLTIYAAGFPIAFSAGLAVPADHWLARVAEALITGVFWPMVLGRVAFGERLAAWMRK